MVCRQSKNQIEVKINSINAVQFASVLESHVQNRLHNEKCLFIALYNICEKLQKRTKRYYGLGKKKRRKKILKLLYIRKINITIYTNLKLFNK